MSYTIREILPNEYGRLHELILEFASFISSADMVSNSAKQLAEDKDLFHCLVVEKDGEIIGFAIYYFIYSSWSGKSLYLEDLYIQPHFRNQGIGKAILDALFEIAKATSCKKMKWQVSGWNEKAKEFYSSQGATIDGTEVNCVKWVV
jgi:GNAT superfamily N-acetyltransferase